MLSIHKIVNREKLSRLQVLLINVRESKATIQKAVKERGYFLPVLLDSKAATARAYGVWGTPGVYLINSAGNVVAGALGPRDWDTPEGLRVMRSFANNTKK
ncbi:MAG: redoxin domain-containing protein [Deltaproteobacteria bacterium]|nr:redoxin domain-containing protein [Deltaproteobacteria bacterium]